MRWYHVVEENRGDDSNAIEIEIEMDENTTEKFDIRYSKLGWYARESEG
jgi:hypothetical protein